jgi:Rad3-related DNA helicase
MPEDKVVIKMGNKEEKNRLYKYFPYRNARDGQKQIIPMVYNLIRSIDYDGIILSAASGIGKEACMTSQALLSLEDNLFDKIIFTIPTDIGKENILKELASVKHGKKVMKLLSKEVLCNWMKEKSDERIRAIESDSCAYQLCNLQGHKCKYKDHGCSYIEQKKEMVSADILICDYNYIISPFIKKMSKFEEIFENNRTLLFIDECHMLIPRAEMILTSSISSTTINRAIEELDKHGFKKEKEGIENILESIKKEISINISKLRSQMNKNYEGLGEVVLKAYNMQKFFGSESLGERLIVLGEYISATKFENKEGIISYSDIVGKFILRFYKRLPFKDNIVFFLKLKNDMKTSYIGWTPLDVRGFLRRAIKESDKFVLYSGTCKPKKLINDVGLRYERVLTSDPIESPYLLNRKDIILIKERFCDLNLRNESFAGRIKDDLDKLFAHMERPIGILCTNNWYENLRLSSTYDILNEPEKQEDVESWLKDLVPNAQIIRFSPYGRIAQSIDMPLLKNIIFLGVPYPKIGPVTEEKINKVAKSYKGKTGNARAMAIWKLIIEPAYEKIIQSVMRGLRNENSRLNVIYYDINYKLNKPALGSKNLVVCKTIDEGISHLQCST